MEPKMKIILITSSTLVAVGGCGGLLLTWRRWNAHLRPIYTYFHSSWIGRLGEEIAIQRTPLHRYLALLDSVVNYSWLMSAYAKTQGVTAMQYNPTPTTITATTLISSASTEAKATPLKEFTSIEYLRPTLLVQVIPSLDPLEPQHHYSYRDFPPVLAVIDTGAHYSSISPQLAAHILATGAGERLLNAPQPVIPFPGAPGQLYYHALAGVRIRACLSTPDINNNENNDCQVEQVQQKPYATDEVYLQIGDPGMYKDYREPFRAHLFVHEKMAGLDDNEDDDDDGSLRHASHQFWVDFAYHRLSQGDEEHNQFNKESWNGGTISHGALHLILGQDIINRHIFQTPSWSTDNGGYSIRSVGCNLRLVELRTPLGVALMGVAEREAIENYIYRRQMNRKRPTQLEKIHLTSLQEESRLKHFWKGQQIEQKSYEALSVHIFPSFWCRLKKFIPGILIVAQELALTLLGTCALVTVRPILAGSSPGQNFLLFTLIEYISASLDAIGISLFQQFIDFLPLYHYLCISDIISLALVLLPTVMLNSKIIIALLPELIFLRLTMNCSAEYQKKVCPLLEYCTSRLSRSSSIAYSTYGAFHTLSADQIWYKQEPILQFFVKQKMPPSTTISSTTTTRPQICIGHTRYILVRALVDTGSAQSFITANLVEELVKKRVKAGTTVHLTMCGKRLENKASTQMLMPDDTIQQKVSLQVFPSGVQTADSSYTSAFLEYVALGCAGIQLNDVAPPPDSTTTTSPPLPFDIYIGADIFSSIILQPPSANTLLPDDDGEYGAEEDMVIRGLPIYKLGTPDITILCTRFGALLQGGQEEAGSHHLGVTTYLYDHPGAYWSFSTVPSYDAIDDYWNLLSGYSLNDWNLKGWQHFAAYGKAATLLVANYCLYRIFLFTFTSFIE